MLRDPGGGQVIPISATCMRRRTSLGGASVGHVRIPEWQPVLRVNEYGLMLGVDADGAWSVGHDESDATAASDALIALLPLLEQPYTNVQHAAAPHVATAGLPPWSQLLRLALTWTSDHWPTCALTWIEDGCPAREVLDTLAWLKDSRERAQPLRHRALRLWKAERERTP